MGVDGGGSGERVLEFSFSEKGRGEGVEIERRLVAVAVDGVGGGEAVVVEQRRVLHCGGSGSQAEKERHGWRRFQGLGFKSHSQWSFLKGKAANK